MDSPNNGRWIIPLKKFSRLRVTNIYMIQDFCEEEWRKSRLEIDCAKGDGLNFIAPKGSRCNPFSSKSEGKAFCEHNHLCFKQYVLSKYHLGILDQSWNKD